VVTEARGRRSEHPPDLTVVVVSYNSSECLARCLRSVAEHLRGAEVLVVDNGSADASVAIARGFSPQVEIIEVGANLGFGRACNLGAKRASGTQLLVLNPDVTIVFACQESLAALAQTVPYGLVVPLLADDPGVQPAHQLYRLRHWLALEFRQLWAPLLPREWQRPRRVVEDPEQAWASGAMLLARRDEFLELGGFDERYFLFSEDVDLSQRYHARGFGLRTTDALVGIHVGGGSSSAVAGSPGVRAGWALLGLLEYVARWYGELSAIRAARIMLATFRLQIVFLSLAAPAGSTRASRKLLEIKSVDGYMRTEAIASRHEPPATENCWQAARAAVREAVGPERVRRREARGSRRASDGQEQV
jgi:N-acetylglucosaminyl-diphospho-decaprenol L-rhamnosyltransferase